MHVVSSDNNISCPRLHTFLKYFCNLKCVFAQKKNHEGTMFYLAGFKTVLRQSQACTNLIGAMNDDVSSVDVEGGCVVLCEHSMCRGRCQEIHYYTSDLSRLGLNDIVSSLKSCES